MDKETKPILLVLKDLVKITETNNIIYPIGYSFPYGGTQFGDYADLGDGRSALIRWNDNSNGYRFRSLRGQELIVKGDMTTAFTLAGRDGSYATNSYKTARDMSLFLTKQGIETETTFWMLPLDENPDKCQCIIARPTILRVGTFEYLKRHNPELIRPCLDHLLSRTEYDDVTEMFSSIVKGYRELANNWYELGFVHGCLNTDNVCAVPCAIDLSSSFITDKTEDGLNKSSSIDHQGRYSLKNQTKELWRAMHIYHSCIVDELDNYHEGDLLDDWMFDYKGYNDPLY